jgi:hypothetical protein
MISLIKKKGFNVRFVALSIFILVGVAFTVAICIANSDKSTSLLEAYNIGYSEARKLSINAKLCLITSVDEPNSTPEQGKNGKRRYWNMIFADSDSSDKQFIISIHDKEVEIEPVQQKIDRTQFINMDDMALTSEEAVVSAITEHGLLPGQDWARGYHFVVVSFDNNIDFQVVGLRNDNKRMRIAFDGSNGHFVKVLMSEGG